MATYWFYDWYPLNKAGIVERYVVSRGLTAADPDDPWRDSVSALGVNAIVAPNRVGEANDHLENRFSAITVQMLMLRTWRN